MTVSITGYDHVGIRVTDAGRSIAFYEALGFRVVEALSSERVAEMATVDGARINLILNGQPRPGGANILMDEPDKWPGHTHAAFIVPKLQAVIDWAYDRGVAITEGPHDWGRRMTCFLRDPDGNVLEFNEPTQQELPASAIPLDGPLILHEYAASGNCYKVRLTAALLGIPLERREYDIVKGETRTAHFLSDIHPAGRIPVLQIGDRFIAESNAACFALADGSPLIPPGRFARADMLRWMFWEQYSHEPYIASLRFWLGFIGIDRLSDAERQQIGAKREAGNAALKLMDDHLSGREWFAGDAMSLADICLFAYTHGAGEGGFALDAHPNVTAWIERLQRHPRFEPMV